ncbi:MAG: 3-hydroxyacyl-[acyl-carrier-protein] dehydratase FabZ [Patescibacteria group bacterium]
MPRQIEITSPSAIAHALIVGSFPPVTQLLPHRGIMLLVDQVEFYDENVITATYRVPSEPFWAAGHFPPPVGPIMRGVDIIEAMAQTAGCHVKLTTGKEAKSGVLVGVDGARFSSKVLPGDTLTIMAMHLRGNGRLRVYHATAMRESKTVAQSNLKIVLTS